MVALAGCGGAISTSPGAATPAPSSATTSSRPTSGPLDSPGSSTDGTGLPTVPPDGASTSPAAAGCSGSDKNRAFFAEAAASMTWPVYCPVLAAGWFLESGTYRLAGGGELEIAYNGPGNLHIAMVEGNACDQFGSDINTCAPRDAVIGRATFGDRTGELGQLSNALVLDVDRGANPTWRVTGLGLSEADFRAICAAMLRVPTAN